MNKFDTFIFRFIVILILGTIIYCGGFVYNSLDSRIQKLEEQQKSFIDIHFIKEGK